MPSSDKHRERPRTTVKAKISKPRSAGVEEEMESPQAMYQRRRNEATAVTSPNRPTTSSGGGGRGVQTAMTTSPQPHQNTAAQQQSSSVATTPQQQKMPTKSILKKKPQEQNGNPPWRLIIVGNEKIRKLFRESGFVSGANSEAKHIELQRQSRRRRLPTDWDDEIQSLSDDTEAQQHEESLLPALVDIPPEQETSEEDDQSTESQPMEDQEGELEEEIAEEPSPYMGHEESDDIPSGDEEKEEPVDVQRPEIGPVQQRENEVPSDEDDQSSLGDEQIPNMRLLEDLDIDEEDDIEDITANYHINPEPMALNINIGLAPAEAQEAHSREEMRHSYDAEPPPRQQQRQQQLVLDEQPSCSYAVPPPLSEKEQIRRRFCDLLGISYFDKIVTDESKEVIMNSLMGLLQNGPDLSEQASYVVSNDADESRSVGSGSHRDDMASPENELLQDADAQEEEMPADDDGHVQAQSPEPQDETDHQPDDDPQDQAVQQPADVDLFDGPIAAVEAPFPDVAEIEDDDDDDEVMEEEENTSDNEVIVRLPKRKPIKRECPPEVEPCVVGTKSGHRAAQEHAQAGAGLELVRQQQNFKEQSQQASAFPMEQQQPQQHYAPWPQSVASQVENQQRQQQQREDFVSQTNSNGGGGHQDEDLDETAQLLEQPLQQKRREALQKFFKERQIQAPNVNERGIATANASLAPPGQQQQHSLSPSPVPPPQPPPPPMAAPLPPPPPPPPDQQPNPIPAGIPAPTSSNAEPQDHRQLDGLWRKRKRPSRRDKVERRKHRERETDQHNVPDTQREKSNTPDAYRQSSRSSKRSNTRSPSGSSRRTWSPSPAPSQASSNNERSANRAPVATSTFVRTAPAPKCKFYNPNQPISSCRDGERCLFFHDRSHPTRSVEIQKMGRKPGDQWPPRLWNCVHYFGKGDCRSGYNCPFSHGDEPTIGSERLREMDARIIQRLQREENSSRKSSIEEELVLTETLNSDSQSPKPAEKVQQIVAPRIPPPPPNIVDNGGGGGTGPSGSTTTLMSRSNIVRTSGQPTPSAAESYVQNVSAFAIPAAHQKKNKPAFAARVQAQEDPLPFFLTAEKSGFKPVLHVADDLELTDSVRSNSPTPSPVPPPHPPQNPVFSSQARQMQLQNGQQPFEASEKENRSVEGSSIQSTSRQRSRSRTRSRSPIRDRRHSRRTRSRVRQRSRSRSRSRSRERRNSRARSLNRGGRHSPPSGHSHSRSSMHRRRRSRTRSRSRSADNSSRRSPQGNLPSQEQMFRKKFHRSPIRKNPKKTKYPPNFKSFTAPGILKYVDDCPFYAWHGFCNYDERCKYSHGDANKTYGYCKAESKVASQTQCRRVFGYDTNMSDEGVGVPPPIIELD